MNVLLLLLLWLQEPPKAVLAGHVLNSATGAPIAKAKVELYREADMQNFLVPASIATIFSDATGAFEFTNLAAGSYVVEPDKDGYMTVPASDRLHTLDDGQHKRDVVLRLAPFGVISGRVRDEEGEPVPHMFVSAMVFSYAASGRILTARASATTDDRGEYRMFEVQPGRYCIGAGPVFARPKSAGNDTSYQTSYFPGVIDPTAATLVELGPGQQLSGIHFVFQIG